MTDPTPPITRTPAPATPEPKKAGVGLGALIGVGIGVVVLSFFAAFLGASLAGSGDAAPEPTSTAPTPTPKSSDEYLAIIDEILPAGAAVRAGQGAPEEGKGYEGDVYINVTTADVYVFRDGAWVWAGNIRESAAENLTGETGATGPQGEQGEPGQAGTQVLLGVGAPDDETCETDGDIYIDTATTEFYQCTAGEWVLSAPAPEQQPSE